MKSKDYMEEAKQILHVYEWKGRLVLHDKFFETFWFISEAEITIFADLLRDRQERWHKDAKDIFLSAIDLEAVPLNDLIELEKHLSAL